MGHKTKSYCGGCVVLFPGPAQLSVTSSTAGQGLGTRLVLQATEAGWGLGTRLVVVVVVVKLLAVLSR